MTIQGNDRGNLLNKGRREAPGWVISVPMEVGTPLAGERLWAGPDSSADACLKSLRESEPVVACQEAPGCVIPLPMGVATPDRGQGPSTPGSLGQRAVAAWPGLGVG
jgi:hypothetical protein